MGGSTATPPMTAASEPRPRRSMPRRGGHPAWNTLMTSLARRAAACVVGLAMLRCVVAAEAIEPGMPNPPASPTRVRCALLIVDVIDIDDVSESFEAKISLVASWHDPRLAFDAAAEGTERKLFQGPYQVAEVFAGWWPQLVLVNEIGLGDITAVTVEVAPDGGVRLMQQRTVRLETPMQLHDYPFDEQRLRAILLPFGSTIDDVVLEVDEDPSTRCSTAWPRQPPRCADRGVDSRPRHPRRPPRGRAPPTRHWGSARRRRRRPHRWTSSRPPRPRWPPSRGRHRPRGRGRLPAARPW